MSGTSVNSVALYAGGYKAQKVGLEYFNQIDVFNAETEEWKLFNLSQPKSAVCAVSSLARFALFAGGSNEVGFVKDVDILDTKYNKWKTAKLSEARDQISCASLGELVVFAGG